MTRVWLSSAVVVLLVSSVASQDLAPESCQRGAPLTKDDIVTLVDAGVPDDTIIRNIRACGVTAVLEAGDAERLQRLGASRRLIETVSPPMASTVGTVWISPIDRREMVWIPAGQFQMGSPADEANRKDDEQRHAQRMSRGYWIDQSEVTYASFQRFVVANPSWQKDRIARPLHDGNYLRDWTGTQFPAGKANQPVVWVSWPAAVAYARWAGKRLSTEAEWEYAARSGTETPYWWGVEPDANRIGLPASVDGDRSRSPWGTRSMLGSVWEWTATVYGPYPYSADDGRENAENSGRRVKRGGAWNSGPGFLRAANRSSESPELTSELLGFRCVQ